MPGGGAEKPGVEGDPRVLAVQGTHRLELALNLLDGSLQLHRKFGRLMRLYFRQRDHSYEWHYLAKTDATESTGTPGAVSWRGRAWKTLGRQVPAEILRTLHPVTRDNVLGMERSLNIRQDGRAVLHLITWLMVHGMEGTPDVIGVTWEGPEQWGRVTWSVQLDGRLMCRGNWQAQGGIPSPYSAQELRFREMIRLDSPLGSYAGTVQREWVDRLAGIDQQLRRLADLLLEQRAGIRLYHYRQKDTWRFRSLNHRGEGMYLPLEQVREAAEHLGPQPRANIYDALDAIGERRQVRRILRVIGILADAGWGWRDGRWIVRGYDTGARGKWMAAADQTGVVGRWYGVSDRGETEEREEGKMGSENQLVSGDLYY
jgi:hypothetical protein